MNNAGYFPGEGNRPGQLQYPVIEGGGELQASNSPLGGQITDNSPKRIWIKITGNASGTNRYSWAAIHTGDAPEFLTTIVSPLGSGGGPGILERPAYEVNGLGLSGDPVAEGTVLEATPAGSHLLFTAPVAIQDGLRLIKITAKRAPENGNFMKGEILEDSSLNPEPSTDPTCYFDEINGLDIETGTKVGPAKWVGEYMGSPVFRSDYCCGDPYNPSTGTGGGTDEPSNPTYEPSNPTEDPDVQPELNPVNCINGKLFTASEDCVGSIQGCCACEEQTDDLDCTCCGDDEETASVIDVYVQGPYGPDCMLVSFSGDLFRTRNGWEGTLEGAEFPLRLEAKVICSPTIENVYEGILGIYSCDGVYMEQINMYYQASGELEGRYYGRRPTSCLDCDSGVEMDIGIPCLVTNKWKCVAGNCIQDADGEFDSEEDCLAECATYDCIGDGCVAVLGPDGEFLTAEDCYKQCGSGSSNCTDAPLGDPEYPFSGYYSVPDGDTVSRWWYLGEWPAGTYSLTATYVQNGECKGTLHYGTDCISLVEICSVLNESGCASGMHPGGRMYMSIAMSATDGDGEITYTLVRGNGPC